jgi:HSP20 family molecular chaperone IbpA
LRRKVVQQIPSVPAALSDLERLVGQLLCPGDGFPPCDILCTHEGRLRIKLAVAGFSLDELAVAVVGDQLIVRGRRQADTAPRQYLHRGIAMRRFQRSFVLSSALRVVAARLENGLLSIDLERTEPPAGRSIPIARGVAGQ